MPDRIGSINLLKVEHMKIKRGLNPEYADFDEIDVDAAEAYDEFDAGNLTFEEFKSLVGPEAAASYVEQYHTPDSLFDNPEDF